MRHWLIGICLGLYAIVCQAAILDDPIEVTVGSESDHVVLSAHFFVPVSREQAWGVLVDFERMPGFLPYLKESKVLFRHGNLLRVQQKGVVPIAFFDVGYTSVRDIELFPFSEIYATTVGGDSGLTRSVSRLLQGDRMTEIDYKASWWPTSSMLANYGMTTARDLLARQFNAMRTEMLKRSAGK